MEYFSILGKGKRSQNVLSPLINDDTMLHIIAHDHVMCYPDQRLMEFLLLQFLENLSLGVRIEGRRSLIHDEYRARLKQCSGNSYALSLSLGKAAALLAAKRVESIGQVINKEGACS